MLKLINYLVKEGINFEYHNDVVYTTQYKVLNDGGYYIYDYQMDLGMGFETLGQLIKFIANIYKK